MNHLESSLDSHDGSCGELGKEFFNAEVGSNHESIVVKGDMSVFDLSNSGPFVCPYLDVVS